MKYKICSKVLNQDEMGKAAQELNEQLAITRGRTPDIFGDKFGTKFVTKFGDKFGDYQIWCKIW